MSFMSYTITFACTVPAFSDEKEVRKTLQKKTAVAETVSCAVFLFLLFLPKNRTKGIIVSRRNPHTITQPFGGGSQFLALLEVSLTFLTSAIPFSLLLETQISGIFLLQISFSPILFSSENQNVLLYPLFNF